MRHVGRGHSYFCLDSVSELSKRSICIGRIFVPFGHICFQRYTQLLFCFEVYPHTESFDNLLLGSRL